MSKHIAVFATALHELEDAKTQPHRIDIGNAHPIRQSFYRQSPHVNAEMNRQREEMLSSDIIDESSSMGQSPVVMVKKKKRSSEIFGGLQTTESSNQAIHISASPTRKCHLD